MQLEALNDSLRELDGELVQLFKKRMQLCEKVAGAKKELCLPAEDTGGERQ